MRDDIAKAGAKHVADVVDINKALVEKTLRMRCLAYLTHIKSDLLTETIYSMGETKKEVLALADNLRATADDLKGQQETIGRQNKELEAKNQELERVRGRLEERTTALARSNASLRELIRGREQAEKALRQAKEEAELANAAKSRFLAAASHDLRQPLQTISLLNGVLSKSIKDEAPLNVVHNMRESLAVMGGLLDALLDISKLEGGVITPEFSVFKVREVLERLRIEFERLAHEKGLGLRITACRTTIRSDAALLERIIHNFMANAIRYTDSGRILVGCRRRGPNLRIEVWDTGVGIPGDQLEKIFEEFYQLDNLARDHNKGQGLGLAIVQRMAKLLGHPIDVRSTPGKGSMFAVEVPIERMAHSPSETRSGEQIVLDSHPEASIVVIEDDEAVLDATRMLLQLESFQVTTAISGEEVMRQLEAKELQPDLIVSDYRLPGGEDGVTLIQRIRQLSGRVIPGIILTGDTTPAKNCELDMDACEMLHKPVDSAQLLTLIHRMLGLYRS